MDDFIASLVPDNDYQIDITRPFISESDNNSCASKIHCSYNLPWCLTKDYKDRHQLSTQDLIGEIYSKTPTKYLWLAGLVHENINIPSSAVHINNNDKGKYLYRNLSYISGKLANNLMENEYNNDVDTQTSDTKQEFENNNSTGQINIIESETSNSNHRQNNNKLICPYDSFQPNLPVHFINNETLQSFPSLSTPLVQYPCLWRFNTINVLPVYYFHGYVLLARVFPKYIHEKIYGKACNALNFANEYIVQGQIFCETDERFLVTTHILHNEIVKFAIRSKDFFLKCYRDDLFTMEKHAINLKKLGLQENGDKLKVVKSKQQIKPTDNANKSVKLDATKNKNGSKSSNTNSNSKDQSTSGDVKNDRKKSRPFKRWKVKSKTVDTNTNKNKNAIQLVQVPQILPIEIMQENEIQSMTRSTRSTLKRSILETKQDSSVSTSSLKRRKA